MSLVLSEGLNPDIDRVILDRAEYERLRSINAELLHILKWYTNAFYSGVDDSKLMESMLFKARAAIERAKA